MRSWKGQGDRIEVALVRWPSACQDLIKGSRTRPSSTSVGTLVRLDFLTE